jgi:3-oxoacyl-[acyl-carrier protein] reductase
VQEIQAMGNKSLAIRTDVCSRDQIEQMVRKTVEAFGTIDILVNNAGGVPQEMMVPALDMSEATWDAVVDLNLKSVFLCSQAVARVMMPRKKGNIVNISSWVAFMASPSTIAYGASKAGVNHLTQTLAYVLGPYNIRVNAIAPGVIPAIQTGEMSGKKNTEFDKWLIEYIEGHRKACPLGRLGTPEDIASVAVFLVSEAAAYVSGQVLSIDGAMPKML